MDNTGLWSTSPKWNFASTMMELRMRGFKTNEETWVSHGSPALFSQLTAWNDDLAKKGSSAAVTTMVVSFKTVDIKKAKTNSLSAMITADPVMIMDSEYFWWVLEDTTKDKSITFVTAVITVVPNHIPFHSPLFRNFGYSEADAFEIFYESNFNEMKISADYFTSPIGS